MQLLYDCFVITGAACCRIWQQQWQSHTTYSRYTFSAKEKPACRNASSGRDDETQYSYFGARYYDSVPITIGMSVWLSVDPMSDKFPHQSPYMYCSGNPVTRIDPNGMWDTDYYDLATGEHISHVNDGIDEAIGVNRSVYNSLKQDGQLSNKTAKQCGGVSLGSNTVFQEIAGTVYSEMDAEYWSLQESEGIACTLENRSNNVSSSILFEARQPDVNGHDEWEAIKDNKSSKANAAYLGTMIMMTSSEDYSYGATGWQGRDFHNKTSQSYIFFYANGFNFTNKNHDIWGMGNKEVFHKGAFGNYNYSYESTFAAGRTIFMRRTDESLRANWPSYKPSDKRRRSMW